MPVEFKRTIFVYGDDFWSFYNAQTLPIQDKIDWVIGLVKTLPIVPEKFLKHIEGTDGMYEIRIRVGSNVFRIFCFFDRGHLIILLNGFQKKSNKTPGNQLHRAINLKKLYYGEY